MREIELTHTFEKQYKKLKRSGSNMALLDYTVEVLMTENTPELKRLWDHQLESNQTAFREIHVSQRASNWVVKYQLQKDGTLLLLLQTGSHNKVMGI